MTIGGCPFRGLSVLAAWDSLEAGSVLYAFFWHQFLAEGLASRLSQCLFMD